MKILAYVSIAVLIMEGCNTKQDQQIKSLSIQDSALMRSSEMKDSTITAYVKTINEVQDNLDSIKVAEKILSVNSFGSENKTSVVSDIRIINMQLLKYHREIYSLEKRLKLVDTKNKEIEKLEIHLSNELAEKDSEIGVLQGMISKSNDSLTAIIAQFNDSMKVINSQNELIADMTTELNTVYYAIGTTKELKKHNVITKDGGFIGIGRTSEMKKNFNMEYFTKEDMTKLTVIPLMGRFDKLLTNHPGNSYTVTNNHKSDSLIIKLPAQFWSISKYLVVVTK
ncbi:MAG TPA: hypothetical protein VK783_01000 [Bacteroidia bacterium]|nr:hypothetical protein [Bacteroidia bacterium]